MKIQSVELISHLESIIKYKDDEFNPFTIEELNTRIDKSMEDSGNDKGIENSTLNSEI